MLEAQHHLDSDLIMALLRLSRPRIPADLLLLEEGINFGRVFIPNLCCGGSGA